jgi:hypothetical protein
VVLAVLSRASHVISLNFSFDTLVVFTLDEGCVGSGICLTLWVILFVNTTTFDKSP